MRTTGQVLRFVVGTLNGPDRSTRPSQLRLPAFAGVGPSSATRRLSLNEMASASFDAPVMGMLGTIDSAGNPVQLGWGAPVTEQLRRNVTETWELHNFTEDAHPIHLHLVQFQVVDRRPFGGVARPPEPGERGLKDTVVAMPSEITRIRATFDKAGRYVWHCHIIDHEDNEMMRPFIVS